MAADGVQQIIVVGGADPAPKPKPSPRKCAAVAPAVTIRFEAPAKSGNPEADEMAKAQFSCLISSVEDLKSCSMLVTPTFNFIRGEKRKLQERSDIGGKASPMFSEVSSLGGMEEEWKIIFVTSNSDLSASDITAVMGTDNGFLNDLIDWALQLPMKDKLPVEFLVKKVWGMFADARYALCGSRLDSFKANGGLLHVSASCRFEEKTGCYILQFNDDDKLIGISHFNGDLIQVDPSIGFSRAHQLVFNHSDFLAQLELKNQAMVQPQKRHTFSKLLRLALTLLQCSMGSPRASKRQQRRCTRLGSRQRRQSQTRLCHQLKW